MICTTNFGHAVCTLLSLPSIALGLIVVVSGMYLATSLHNAFLSPLAKVPCVHPIARFSRLWILWQKWQNCENQALLRAHERLGPIVRTASYEVSINFIENGVQVVYGTKFDKSSWYQNVFREDK